MASNYTRQDDDAADTKNWDDYYFSFNQTFALLDADWTDPKRFPKGKQISNKLSETRKL